MKQSYTSIVILASALALSTSTLQADSKARDYDGYYDSYAFAKVTNVSPVYHEIRVNTPYQECWKEPVTRRQHVRGGGHSAGSTLAGGIIGGIIGHQFGKGRGQKISTAVGTIIGAQMGHDAARKSHSDSHSRYTRYEDFCEVQHRVTYEKEIDSYNVTYRYKGKKYNTNMPYDPGKKIKLRITVEPVF